MNSTQKYLNFPFLNRLPKYKKSYWHECDFFAIWPLRKLYNSGGMLQYKHLLKSIFMVNHTVMLTGKLTSQGSSLQKVYSVIYMYEQKHANLKFSFIPSNFATFCGMYSTVVSKTQTGNALIRKPLKCQLYCVHNCSYKLVPIASVLLVSYLASWRN